jgi:hypothetical protein
MIYKLQWFGGWGGGLLSEWAYQDRAKNILFTSGAHIDLVLKCAWFCCIKFKISCMTYLVLNILSMGGGEREGKWGWAAPGHRSNDFEGPLN